MIWLIGNKGMLGTELSFLLEKNGLPFVGTDRELDITNLQSIKDFSLKYSFDWIINCAAYTMVDKAEDDEETCRLINTIGPANIAMATNSNKAKLIHISTDYVFDGKGNRPYTEEDTTLPIGVYGLSKRDGENMVLKENTSSFIIRTAWLYGSYGNNFVNTMLKLMKEKETISVVMDQKGSPTWSFDLSSLIVLLIKKFSEEKNIPFGIYHFTNEGICTWFDFARAIYEEGRALNILSKTCEVKPCTSVEYPARVKRPAYSVLDKSKIKENLGLEIPDWKFSLIKYLTLMTGQK
jgi:dTDP-4-dehydrorhamnose reductase